jgi:VWFA-related protein
MRRLAISTALAAFGLSALLAAAAMGSNAKAIAELDARFRAWLEEVELLITKKEQREFLALEKDYQRDAFIERFWQARDPYVETQRNELKDAWYARLEYAREEFGSLTSDRARLLLLNGEPDVRLPLSPCPTLLHPVEVWFYEATRRSGRGPKDVFLLFYRRLGLGDYELWRPRDGVSEIFAEPPETLRNRCPGGLGDLPATSRFNTRDVSLECAIWILRNRCDPTENSRAIEAALRKIQIDDKLGGFEVLVSRLESPPEARDSEWLDTFAAYSTDVPVGAESFAASLEIDYPGRRQSRTVLRGTIAVASEEARVLDLEGRRSYNFLLVGEILRSDGTLFESFRYRFEVPADQVRDQSIPMSFERTLRPGEFGLVVRLEDLNAGRFFHAARDLSVPEARGDFDSSPPADPETARLEAEAEQAILSDRVSLRLVPPEGERLIGPLRFETAATGRFDRVSFFLDGKLMLTKKQPPFSIELDLGRVPRPHTMRVVGYDASGQTIAADEIELNVGSHQFTVKLVEPRRNRRYEDLLTAEAEVALPEGKSLDRLEVFLGETLLATLYQPPYRQPIRLPPHGSITYVRAVAHLEDGNSTEDMVFINAPDLLEEVDIQFVELFTSVVDGAGRPLSGLTAGDFGVLEDGIPQTIVRFEVVRDLPIHAGIVFDTSASMAERLNQARDAALSFFRQIILPKDRAAVVTFNHRPTLAAKFTADLDALAGELAGLKAEGGTALYDSIVFSLYYFTGIKGQRALLILSDGQDQSSRYSFSEALQYAQTVGVKIYTIGLDLPRTDTKSRGELAKLADATGGRAYFVEEVAELTAIYSAIEAELRSQYLIAYQSSNTAGGSEFRSVDVELVGREAEVRTLRGYYP